MLGRTDLHTEFRTRSRSKTKFQPNFKVAKKFCQRKSQWSTTERKINPGLKGTNNPENSGGGKKWENSMVNTTENGKTCNRKPTHYSKPWSLAITKAKCKVSIFSLSAHRRIAIGFVFYVWDERTAQIALEMSLPKSTWQHFQLIVSIIIHISADLSLGISCAFHTKISLSHVLRHIWTCCENPQLLAKEYEILLEKYLFFFKLKTLKIFWPDVKLLSCLHKRCSCRCYRISLHALSCCTGTTH